MKNLKRKTIWMKEFILPCVSWVEENSKVLPFLWNSIATMEEQEREEKYRFSSPFVLLWASWVLELKRKNEAICEAKRGWRRSVWWSGMERVYEYSCFWWSILWGFGVVFIVVFLENIIIITHRILWIWGISFENYLCLVSFFPKIITCILKNITIIYLLHFLFFFFDLKKIK